MPATKHEVQSFDCHPIPGERCPPIIPIFFFFKKKVQLFLGNQPPSLLISVSGNVTHGSGPSGNPPDIPARSIEGHPRVFSQTFILVPDPTAPPTKPGEVAKYYVGADALRFVG